MTSLKYFSSRMFSAPEKSGPRLFLFDFVFSQRPTLVKVSFITFCLPVKAIAFIAAITLEYS